MFAFIASCKEKPVIQIRLDNRLFTACSLFPQITLLPGERLPINPMATLSGKRLTNLPEYPIPGQMKWKKCVRVQMQWLRTELKQNCTQKEDAEVDDALKQENLLKRLSCVDYESYLHKRKGRESRLLEETKHLRFHRDPNLYLNHPENRVCLLIGQA
ncbi:hypothetical protein [Paenibacillus sonchi]|uniref:hypothetical protein n=1 Tax=Paenibacillus sonchi TaxID=373687 RepID=UPI001E2E951F|nr:hypothetical protein [Paenibacillus sonchi]